MDVLIENYNTENGKYELGKQEISYINFESLKDLLENISLESSIDGFPVKIITKDSRIKRILDPSYPKSNKKYFKINFLYKGIHIKEEKEIKDLSDTVLEDLLFSDLHFIQKIKVILKLSLIFLYTFIALFAYIFALLAYLRYMIPFSLFFLVLWIWLVALSIFDFISSILQLKSIKSYHKRLIYSSPMINKIKTHNISKLFIRTTISYGALTYLLPGLILPDLKAQFERLNSFIFLTLIIISIFSVLTSTGSILKRYLKNKKKKLGLLHSLNKFIQEKSNDDSIKQYHNKIILEIRNRSLIKVGFFSQFVAILTLFLTTVPLLSSLS